MGWYEVWCLSACKDASRCGQGIQQLRTASEEIINWSYANNYVFRKYLTDRIMASTEKVEWVLACTYRDGWRFWPRTEQCCKIYNQQPQRLPGCSPALTQLAGQLEMLDTNIFLYLSSQWSIWWSAQRTKSRGKLCGRALKDPKKQRNGFSGYE